MSASGLKRTALNEEHRALGARLTDFGGWEMPLHYGSQLEEHHRVRRDAGMFDVSHMLAVDIAGEGAEPFLRALLANDVKRLTATGRALYSCMLNEDAGVLDDLIAYRFGPSEFRVVVNAGTADKDLDWMRQQLAARGDRATMRPRRDLAMLAVQGPQARERFWAAWPATRQASESLKTFQAAQLTADGVDLVIARTGYTGEDGFEVMLPADRCVDLWRRLMDAQVAPCGLGARDTLRLEAGMNLYGQDMDESVTPMEAGLAWTVNLDPGHDFIGRQALERRSPRFQLLGLLLQDKGVLRSHQPVRAAGGEGLITSGTFSPTLSRSIALARLPLTAQAGDRVEVQIRGKWLHALAVKYPFVRKGQPLIELDHPTPPEKMQ